MKYNQIKYNVLHHLILSGNFIYLRIKNLAWEFWGVNFWSRDFWGFCWMPEGFFWVLIFAPILSFPSLEIWGTNPHPLPPLGCEPIFKQRGHYALASMTATVSTPLIRTLLNNIIKDNTEGTMDSVHYITQQVLLFSPKIHGTKLQT